MIFLYIGIFKITEIVECSYVHCNVQQYMDIRGFLCTLYVMCKSTQREQGSNIHCNVEQYTDNGGFLFIYMNVQHYTDSGGFFNKF
jgi:hypothetical protein